MKIIYLSTNLSVVGGIQVHNKAFYEALKKTGNSIKLIELKNSSYFEKIRFIIQVFSTSITTPPKLIITGHINFSPLCLFLKIIFGIKYAVTAHGIDVWNLKSILKIQGLKNADIIISVSHYTANRMKNEILGIGGNILVIPNTVDSKLFTIKEKSPTLITKYNISDKKIILTVARLSIEEGYKGYKKIIQSLPQVLKEIPNVHYIVVGDGDDKVIMENLVAKLGLERNVTFAGKVSSDVLPDYYNLADVFAMPSLWEGFGIVFIESTACGIPVIAGNKDGSTEATLNGELGLLINPENTEEIGKAIIRILSGQADINLYNRKELRRKTIEAFGWESFYKKVFSLVMLFDK